MYKGPNLGACMCVQIRACLQFYGRRACAACMYANVYVHYMHREQVDGRECLFFSATQNGLKHKVLPFQNFSALNTTCPVEQPLPPWSCPSTKAAQVCCGTSTSATAGLPLLLAPTLSGSGSHIHAGLPALLLLLPWKTAAATKGAEENPDTDLACRELW